MSRPRAPGRLPSRPKNGRRTELVSGRRYRPPSAHRGATASSMMAAACRARTMSAGALRSRKPPERAVGHKRHLTGDEDLPQMGLSALVCLVHDAVHRHEPDDHRECTEGHRHGQVARRLPHQRTDGHRSIHIVPRSHHHAGQRSTRYPHHRPDLPCSANAMAPGIASRGYRCSSRSVGYLPFLPDFLFGFAFLSLAILVSCGRVDGAQRGRSIWPRRAKGGPRTGGATQTPEGRPAWGPGGRGPG